MKFLRIIVEIPTHLYHLMIDEPETRIKCEVFGRCFKTLKYWCTQQSFLLLA